MIFYHLLILFLLLGFCASLGVNLFVFRTVERRKWVPSNPSEPESTPSEAPFISVLVPARNEELRVGPCAASLACQEYPNFEVLILDDHSEDGTVQVLQAAGYSEEPGQFRILRSKPLPAGWTGKAWACHQLAEAARGERLLFLDADTEHHPLMISSALAMAEETQADLLSAWPRLVLGSWSEKFVLPVIHLALIFYPYLFWNWVLENLWFAKKFPPTFWRRFGAANGQFLFFKRSAYERIGGHASVAQHMVEDVALGRQMASRVAEGLRLVNCDGQHLSTVRMYTNFSEVWEGFTKNVRAVFEAKLSAYLFAGFFVNATLLLPFVFVWFTHGLERWVILAQIALIYLMRVGVTVRFRTTWFGLVCHPIGLFLATCIGLNSWRRSAGVGVVWKGRNYEVVHPTVE